MPTLGCWLLQEYEQNKPKRKVDNMSIAKKQAPRVQLTFHTVPKEEEPADGYFSSSTHTFIVSLGEELTFVRPARFSAISVVVDRIELV